MRTPDVMESSAAQSRVHSVMKRAFSQVGNPYRYGGSTPETGFDCSGFVGWVYKQFGIDLPRSSRDMMAAGQPISRSELRPGDLVFFNYGYSHVGIYTGNGRYIHSPSTGKRIQESDLNGRGRSEHFVGARRIIDNKGVTAISDQNKAEWVQASRFSAVMAMNDSAARRHTGAAAWRGRTPRSGSSRAATASARRASSRTDRASASRTSRTAKNSKAQNHKVASGDTLVHLAKRYGVTATDIASYNGLADRNRIKPGQSIKIPPKKADKKDKKGAAAKASGSKSGKKASSASAKSGKKAGAKVVPKAKAAKKGATA
jgi:LysM repeat protein